MSAEQPLRLYRKPRTGAFSVLLWVFGSRANTRIFLDPQGRHCSEVCNAELMYRAITVDDRAPKPGPESFLERIKTRMRHGDNARVLVIGDTEIDLGYFHNLGVASCWAAYGYGIASRCEVLAPDFVIQSATSLLRLEDCRASKVRPGARSQSNEQVICLSGRTLE